MDGWIGGFERATDERRGKRGRDGIGIQATDRYRGSDTSRARPPPRTRSLTEGVAALAPAPMIERAAGKRGCNFSQRAFVDGMGSVSGKLLTSARAKRSSGVTVVYPLCF